MKECSFDEMIAYFNRRVADMDISQDCKMELLGMVTALGYKHEKSAQQWIPCSECMDKIINELRSYIVEDDEYAMDENVQGFNDGIQTAITILSTYNPWKGEQE